MPAATLPSSPSAPIQQAPALRFAPPTPQIDAFGGLHWDSTDVLAGLKVFAPLLVVDALLMLPDYSVDPKEARTVSNVVLGPELTSFVAENSAAMKRKLRQGAGLDDATGKGKRAAVSGSEGEGAAASKERVWASDGVEGLGKGLGDGQVGPAEGASPAADGPPTDRNTGLDEPGVRYPPAASPEERFAAAVLASSEGKGDKAGSTQGQGQPGPLRASWIRGRMGLELYQSYHQRRNPGATLSPAAEFLVVVVAELTNEMLYRAVVLTLLSYWVRRVLHARLFGPLPECCWALRC